jgi:hypothetical protein
VIKQTYERITKQFMCEWIVECKTLKNKLEQKLMHNKLILNV